MTIAKYLGAWFVLAAVLLISLFDTAIRGKSANEQIGPDSWGDE